MKTTVSDVQLTTLSPRGGLQARKCPKCEGRVFLHRRRKPFACKTCGHKMERRMS